MYTAGSWFEGMSDFHVFDTKSVDCFVIFAQEQLDAAAPLELKRGPNPSTLSRLLSALQGQPRAVQALGNRANESKGSVG